MTARAPFAPPDQKQEPVAVVEPEHDDATRMTPDHESRRPKRQKQADRTLLEGDFRNRSTVDQQTAGNTPRLSAGSRGSPRIAI